MNLDKDSEEYKRKRERARVSEKKYAENNREKMREYERKYRERNREVIRQRALARYYKDRERQLELSKKRRQNNKEYYRRKKNEYRLATLKWVEEMKREKGCKVCGTKEKLQYHHRNPKEKFMAIADMISQAKNKDLILKEIEKCDVLCKPCHDKEHTQFNDLERKERKARRNKQWRIKNQERMKQYKKNNRERDLAKARERYKNPEIRQKYLERNRLWRKNNPEKARESDRRKWEKQKLKKAQSNSLDSYI